MMGTPRPSGATLHVVKTFSDPADAECALALASQAAGVALPCALAVTGDRGAAIRMPLAAPTTSIELAHATYARLWQRSPLFREGVDSTLAGYWEYMQNRYDALQAPGTDRAAQKIGSQFWSYFVDLFTGATVIAEHRPQAATHGDATVQNVVVHEGRGALIDFSPRSTPSLVEIDIAKLIVSAILFEDALVPSLGDLMGLTDLGAEVPLVKLFAASHLIRVLSREGLGGRVKPIAYTGAFRHVQSL